MSLSWATSIQSTSPNPVSFKMSFSIFLTVTPRSLKQCLSLKTLHQSQVCHRPCAYNPPWFHCLNCI
jgi:hypothetical protein